MQQKSINFMPGPVNLHPDTKKVYHDTFLSHRSDKFYADVKKFQNDLCDYVNSENVAFFVGSGSLGNEVCAQYLKQLGGKGLILINGEFSRRLKDQASHIELDFETLDFELGDALDYLEIERVISSRQFSWMWFVNCETSSGVLNDLNRLKKIAAAHHTKVAVDCISTIGNTPVDLGGVFVASGTSGKGLASYPGISLVFYSDELLQLETRGIPKYMNLKHHGESNSVPYTISTNLFYALVHAFESISNSSHQAHIKFLSDYIYNQLSQIGFTFLGKYENMMPGIISIICPPEINSHQLGIELEKNNFYVNYGGAYLKKGNYFQICLMGHHTNENAEKLIEFLKSKNSSLPLQIAS